jgi:ribosomal protein S18 acetylase RimI-like enzyme
MSLRIAPLAADHRDSLRDLLVATRAFSAEEVGVALELFDSVYEAGAGPSVLAVAPDYEFAGAFNSSNELHGYACFGPTPMTDGTYDLYWLAVHPDAQRAGVGRALVKHVERELADRAARLLVVETSSRPDYAHTRAFYARNGYEEAARLRDFYAPADDRIIFTTRLARERGVVTHE